MRTRTALVASMGLIAAGLAVGLAVSSRLADPMPSHWNAAGEVDGYMSQAQAVWMLPLMSWGLVLLLAAIPNIDPLKANIAKFRGTYNQVIVGFAVFMMYVYGLTLAAGLGYAFNMTSAMMPAMGLLFIGLGLMLRRAKRNFFIGIRTPWTLSSDEVWERTHRLGSAAFIVAGVIVALSGFFGDAGFWVMMVAILGAALAPIVYSYVLFARLERTR